MKRGSLVTILAGLALVFGSVLIYDSAVAYVLWRLQGARGFFGFDVKEFAIGIVVAGAATWSLYRFRPAAGNRGMLPIGLFALGIVAPLVAGFEIKAPLWFTSRTSVSAIEAGSERSVRNVRSRYIKWLDDDKDPPRITASVRSQTAAVQDTSPQGVTSSTYDVLVACGDGRLIDAQSSALVETASGTIDNLRFHNDAESLLRQAIEVDPKNLIAYDRLALYYMSVRNRPGAAVQLYDDALSVFPDCASTHFQLATAYTATGQHDRARDQLKEAIGLTPDPPASYFYNLANNYLRAKNSSDAAVYYRKALARDPGHKKARNNLTRAYLALRNVDALLAMHGDDAESLR